MSLKLNPLYKNITTIILIIQNKGSIVSACHILQTTNDFLNTLDTSTVIKIGLLVQSFILKNDETPAVI